MDTILKRLRYSLLIADSVKLLSNLIILFLRRDSIENSSENLPLELEKMFPNRSNRAWREKTENVISTSIQSILPSLLSTVSVAVREAGADFVFRERVATRFFDFRPKFRFLATISIFDQNFDF